MEIFVGYLDFESESHSISEDNIPTISIQALSQEDSDYAIIVERLVYEPEYLINSPDTDNSESDDFYEFYYKLNLELIEEIEFDFEILPFQTIAFDTALTMNFYTLLRRFVYSVTKVSIQIT